MRIFSDITTEYCLGVFTGDAGVWKPAIWMKGQFSVSV